MALSRLLISVLLALGLAAPAVHATIDRSALRRPVRGWASGPVWYLMTTREYTTYRSLRSEGERRSFIRQFWNQRDPLPETHENELEREFLNRLSIADGNFTQDVKPGWKTERGKVFIMLGPPLNLEEDRILDDRYGASRWTYDFSGMPPVMRDVLRETLRVPRDRDLVDLKVLEEAEGARIAGGTFVSSSSILRPSGSFRLADSLVTRYGSMEGLRHLGEVMRVPEVVERARMEVNVSTVFRLIPVEARVDFRRGQHAGREDGTAIAVTLGVQDSALVAAGVSPFDASGAIVSGYLRRTTQDGGPSTDEGHYNLTGTFEPDPRPDPLQKTHVFQAISTLPPGRYDLHLSYRDTNKHVMGSLMSTIEVPHFGHKGLSVSSVVLSDRLDRLESPDYSRAGMPFSLGMYQVIPRTSPLYRTGEDLTVFYQVHGSGTGPDGRPLLDITYQFYVDDQSDWLPIGSAITKKQTRGTSQAWRVPLHGLPGGRYRLEITVTDQVGGESIVREALFEVLTKPEV